MKDVLVSIDGAGRIVLPKQIRDDLAIQPGDLLRIALQGASVTLVPIQEKTGFKRKGKALVFTTNSDEILDQDTVNQIVQEIRARPLSREDLQSTPKTKRK